MLPVGFEPAILRREWPQNYVLHCAVTVIGKQFHRAKRLHSS